jgi:hypothetical protein
LKFGRHSEKNSIKKRGFGNSMRAGMQSRAGGMAGVPLEMEMESIICWDEPPLTKSSTGTMESSKSSCRIFATSI